jgi:hypothetical protein
MNPHASPWYRRPVPVIRDQQLRWRWQAINQHLARVPDVIEYRGMLMINDQFYICKNSSKMRLKSHLDWVHYTPRTLAQAIDQQQVPVYYEFMMQDHRSDPNVWNDRDFEMQLKSFYAARAGRCSPI